MSIVASQSATRVIGIARSFLSMISTEPLHTTATGLASSLILSMSRSTPLSRGTDSEYISSVRRNWPPTENTGNRTNIWMRTLQCAASVTCSASWNSVGLKCSSRLKKDRGHASIFMSRTLTAFSALVNRTQTLSHEPETKADRTQAS